jgi:hypothetical protein
MTKTGHGKYLIEVKCPTRIDESWTMTFTTNKLVLVIFLFANSLISKPIVVKLIGLFKSSFVLHFKPQPL